MATIIRGFTGWKSFISTKVLTRYLVIENMGDIHFFSGVEVNSEEIILSNCDKNFIAYWLTRNTFPNAKTIYLDSHPCEPYVLQRNFNIYLSDRYSEYRDRWVLPNNTNVNIIPKWRIDELIQNLKE